MYDLNLRHLYACELDIRLNIFQRERMVKSLCICCRWMNSKFSKVLPLESLRIYLTVPIAPPIDLITSGPTV